MMETKDNYLLYFTLFYFIGSVYGACSPMLKDDILLFTKYDPTKTYTGVSNEHELPQRRSLSIKQEATPSPPPPPTPVQETTTDKNADKEEKITVDLQEVFDKFFLKNTFKDECISKHNQDFWKFKSSESEITPNPAEPTKNSIFVRKYVSTKKEEGKQFNYEATGKFFMQPGTPYISWDAQGGIEGYKKHEQKSGQIYILDIQNVNDAKYKSLITYYSCFEGTDFLNDNIYVSQTMVKYKTGKEVSVNKAIDIVKEKLKNHKSLLGSKAWDIECYLNN